MANKNKKEQQRQGMTASVKKLFAETEAKLKVLTTQDEALHSQIKELKAQTIDCKCNPRSLVSAPYRLLVGGRVNHPAVGGLALPENVGFHGYVQVEVDEFIDDDGTKQPPSREYCLLHLQQAADEKFPQNSGVDLCDISVIPTWW